MGIVEKYIKNSNSLDDINIHEAEITTIQDGFWDCNNKGLFPQETNFTKRKEKYSKFFLKFIVLSDCERQKKPTSQLEKEMVRIDYQRKKSIVNYMKKFAFGIKRN